MMRQVISCVYSIENLVNGKIYIGSSENFPKRKNEHWRKLRKNIHHSPKLQRGYNKYGKDNFRINIIEECSPDVAKIREQHYIDTLNPWYNCSKSAFCPMKGRKHSKKTLEKFKDRKVLSGEEHPYFGTTWSDELREKILTARIGQKRSDEFKDKQRANAIKLNLGKNLDAHREEQMKEVIDSLGNEFKSLMEASKFHNMSVQAVCDILKGRTKKSKKGVTFAYKNS